MRPDVAKLRQTILQLAVEGKLILRDENEKSAHLQVQAIHKLIKEGGIKIREINNPKSLNNIEVPEHWEKVKLGSILFVTKLAGFEYTKYIKLSDVGEVPVVRAQNVRNWIINDNNPKYISSEISDLLERSALTKKSVLITFIGANIGQVAYFNEPKRWHLAPNVAKVEPYNGTEAYINLRYITLFLLSSIGQSELFKHMKATAQPSLSMGTIRDIDISLPPIKEQDRIVEKVDALNTLYDELDEKSDNLLESLAKLRKTISRMVVSGEYTSTFESGEVQQVIDINFGTRITKKEHKGEKYPVYGGGGESFRTDNYNREDEWVVSRFAMSKECVRKVSGKFFMLDSGFTFDIKNEYKDNIDKDYIGNCLLGLQTEIYDNGRGMAQKNIDIRRFKQMGIPIPSLVEQKRIVEKVEALMSLCDELEAKL